MPSQALVGGTSHLGRYLGRRLVQLAPVIVLVLSINFALVHLAPGDPIYVLAGDHGSEAYYQEMRAKYGLDRPLPEQLLRYVTRAIRGDLGYSYTHGQPVLVVVMERIPATLLLMVTAQILSLVLGIGAGLLAATHSRRTATAIRVLAALGYALPAFWTAQLLILIFAPSGLFPTFGMNSIRESYVGVRRLVDTLHHLVLPSVSLALMQLGLLTRLTDTGIRNLAQADFVRTARGKGLAQRSVIWRHMLPNAMLPIVALIGNRIGTLLTGAVLVETVFAWPGLGRLLYNAALSRDYPLLMAMFLVSAATVLVVSILTDVAYIWLDPRVRYE